MGLIVGVMEGATLPSKFIEPLHDCLDSYIPEFTHFKISELARRTLQIIRK